MEKGGLCRLSAIGLHFIISYFAGLLRICWMRMRMSCHCQLVLANLQVASWSL